MYLMLHMFFFFFLKFKLQYYKSCVIINVHISRLANAAISVNGNSIR